MRKPISKEEFQRRIQMRYPSENFNIITYESLGKPCVLQCDSCKENINLSKASNFFAKGKRYGCINCHGLWKDRDKKIEKIKERYDIIKIEVLPNGQSKKKYYTVKCKKCGHIRRNVLWQLEKNIDCGCITGMYKWTMDDFSKKLNEKFPDYQLVEEYKGMQEKHLIKHKCGFVFKTRLSDFYYADKDSHRCPKCKKRVKRMSNGQQKVKETLEDLKLEFFEEKYLDNSLLRFDFYFELNEKKYAIEYNGEQHYRPVEYFGGIERFNQQKERDNRKREYCCNNNINLLEISYKEKLLDIPIIIKNFINSTTKVVQVNEKAPQPIG